MKTNLSESTEGLDRKEAAFQWLPLLLVLTLIAGVLRFYRLGEWSFWIDELMTIERAQAHYGSLDSLTQHLPPYRKWVPSSFIMTSVVIHAFGVSEWSARAASAAIGTLSIPILFFPIKAAFGGRVALLSVFFLTISPWHLFWSQNARFYTALLLFFTLALLAFHQGLEKNRPDFLLVGFLFLYLAVSERYFSLFLVPVMACYIVALWIGPFERPPGFNRRNLFILASPLFFGLLAEGFAFVTNRPSYFVAGFLNDFEWFFSFQNYTPLRLLGGIVLSIGAPLLLFALLSGFNAAIRKNHAALLLLISALLPLLVIVPASLFMFTEDRYVFGTLTSWIILASVGIREIWLRLGSRTLLGLAMVGMLAAEAASDNLMYFRVNHGNRRQWKEAFQLVREKALESDRVVAFWPEFGPVYLGRSIEPWNEIKLATVIRRSERTWFVVDFETVWGIPEKKDWVEKNARLIEVFSLRTPADLQLRVYLFDPLEYEGSP